MGIEVKGIASNGEIAVDMFKSFNPKPEIILMDYRMPLKNGLEATIEILQIDPNTKIIFASADISVKEKAIALGAIEFLEKPFSIQTVLNIINKINNSTPKQHIY